MLYFIFELLPGKHSTHRVKETKLIIDGTNNSNENNKNIAFILILTTWRYENIQSQITNIQASN